MNKTNKHSCVFRLPIVAVYLLFFTVQIFFNLDTNRCLFNADKAVAVYSAPVSFHGKTAVRTAATHSSSHSKLRLNKRYEPSNVPVPVVAVIDLPCIQTAPLQIGTHIRQFYSSVFLSTNGLRGPPCVA